KLVGARVKASRYIIIGGGGFGLELLTYLQGDIKSGALPADTGIALLNDSEQCEVLTCVPGLRYLGAPGEFVAEPGDEALIAIGNPVHRKRLSALIRAREIPLGRYIHPTAWVAANARLGAGVILCPNVVVSAFATIGDNVAVNVFGGVGHGATVGAHTVMGPYSVINGDCVLGEGCLLGTRVTLFPKVHLGRGCSVDTHTAVRRSASDFTIISVKRQDQEAHDRITARELDRT
ncbi:MAG: hypothetical protein WCI78_17710, partial [Mycobacterium sp.]